MNDLSIRNARLCDGTGAPIFEGAVGVRDGLIAEIGGDVSKGREDIDAEGLVLSPGIIDSHTHYDAQVTWDPYVTPSVSLGVSSVVMGNCGFTIAPCRKSDREKALKNLTQVEAMSLAALTAGTRWEFESFGEYLDMLERLGTVANTAAFCGHSSVRIWVMGEEASERTATDAEIVAMKQIIAESLQQGAIGFATSTYESHNGWGGTPMPSRFADEREMRALVGTLGEQGKGMFMLTKGLTTNVPFLESLAADTQRPVMVAALQYDHANPNKVFDDIRNIDEAVARGRRMYGQVACTPVSMEFTMTGAYVFEGMRCFKPAIALYQDKPALIRMLSDGEFRAAMKKELVEPGSLNRFTDQWHEVEVLEVAKPANKHLEHRMVADLAKEDGKHPVDWLLDFAIEEDLGTLFNAMVLNSDEEQVLKLLKSPNTNISLSDAGAHLFLFCDAGFGLHMLGRWVRERGDFTLEEAVAELTGRQAAIFGIGDRGTLQVGKAADLLLFDPQTVGRAQKRRVSDLPSGASRLTTDPIGIHGLWVNGTRVSNAEGVIENGARPGKVLRSFVS